MKIPIVGYSVVDLLISKLSIERKSKYYLCSLIFDVYCTIEVLIHKESTVAAGLLVKVSFGAFK